MSRNEAPTDYRRTAFEKRVHNARERARWHGLRLRRQGDHFSLQVRDQQTIVAAGDIDTIISYLGGPARVINKPIPPAWREILEEYLIALRAAGRSPNTIRLRREQVVRLARDTALAPTEITFETLVSWFGNNEHWKPEMRRNLRAGLRDFFGWASATGRIPTDPAAGIERVKRGVGVPRPASEDAFKAALNAASPRVALMLRLAGEAGLRRAEVAQVQTSDLIEGASGTQLLVRGKGNRPRLVPLSEDLAKLVAAGPAGHTPNAPSSGWLFPDGEGSHLSPPWIGALVSRALPAGVTMHALRHRFATRAYRGSRNLRAVQNLLGHASIAMTALYTAVDDDELRTAAMMATL